jgi:hypothetical protein
MPTTKSKFLTSALLAPLLFLSLACGSSSQSASTVRDAFIKSGGTCSNSDGPAPTTTVSSKEPDYPIVESINCGEDEALITVYKSEDDAKKQRFLLESLTSGVMLSIGSEASESFGIFLGSTYIYIPNDAYQESEVKQIADEMGGSYHSNFDMDFRNSVFNKIASNSINGGMTEAANGCAASELMSNDAVSITFDTKGKEDAAGDSLFSAFCVLKALVAPDYIFDSVTSTRALDGRIEESWGTFRASWSYHPDDGMDMTILFEG